MVGVFSDSLVVKHLLVGSMLYLMSFVQACLQRNCVVGAKAVILNVQTTMRKLCT
jgi:hypothetical protein